MYSYTAQLLYIGCILTFGQHYEIEALRSEIEVSPAVWNTLTPEYRDQVKKKHCLEQKDVYSITLSI